MPPADGGQNDAVLAIHNGLNTKGRPPQGDLPFSIYLYHSARLRAMNTAPAAATSIMPAMPMTATFAPVLRWRCRWHRPSPVRRSRRRGLSARRRCQPGWRCHRRGRSGLGEGVTHGLGGLLRVTAQIQGLGLIDGGLQLALVGRLRVRSRLGGGGLQGLHRGVQRVVRGIDVSLGGVRIVQDGLGGIQSLLERGHESLVYADSLSFSASATRPASLEVSTRSSRAAMASFRFW